MKDKRQRFNKIVHNWKNNLKKNSYKESSTLHMYLGLAFCSYVPLFIWMKQQKCNHHHLESTNNSHSIASLHFSLCHNGHKMDTNGTRNQLIPVKKKNKAHTEGLMVNASNFMFSLKRWWVATVVHNTSSIK